MSGATRVTMACAGAMAALAATGVHARGESAAPSGCPMHAKGVPSGGPASGCPMHATPASPPAHMSGNISECPMHASSSSGGLNPVNNMPAKPAQERAPGQTEDLSTERVTSSIPITRSDAKWTYPSPQMFWNSLVRKGKEGGASEADMDTVVAVHDSMNEATWNKVLEWEDLKTGSDHPPTLTRFTGRPTELSPKARLKNLFGHPTPFDRHDWIVDRGGVERRYVIDYYSDESLTHADETPKSMHDIGAVKSILIDVRPALDSLDAVVDRLVRMPLRRLAGDASPALPFFMQTNMGTAPKEETTESLKNEMVALANRQIGAKCSERFSLLANCGEDEKKCADASIALQHCIASVVCPKEAEQFRVSAASADADPAAVERAYEQMDLALDAFQKKAAAAREATPR